MSDFNDFMGGLGNGIIEISHEPWNFLDHTVDKTAGVIDHGVDKIGDIFSSLQMPLILGGAVILIIMMNK